MDSGSPLRTAYVTAILDAAVRRFPVDVLSFLGEIETAFPMLLSRVHEEAVFTFFNGLIGAVPADSAVFLWGFMRAVCPEVPFGGPEELPAGVVACGKVAISQKGKVRVIELLGVAAKTFGEAIEFRVALGACLPGFLGISQELAFTVGLSLQPSAALVSRALALMASKSTPARDLEAGLRYLAYAYDASKIEPVVNFLYRILRSSSTNNFVLQAATALVAATFSRATYPRFFAKVVQHCVARAWNRKPRLRGKLLYRAAVLEIAATVGDTPSWAGWEQFDRVVLRPYARREEFPRDFMIPEGDWDHGLVERLKTQPDVLLRSAIDRKPSSGDLLAFVVTEELIVDDPREALDGEPAVEHYEDYDVLVVQRMERRRSRRKKGVDDDGRHRKGPESEECGIA
jgi:hypothetical protein